MPLNGFHDIWDYLQSLEIDEELHRLNELARFPRDCAAGQLLPVYRMGDSNEN